MDKLVRITAPVASAWGRLTAVQKAAATLVSVVAVIALLVAVGMASRPQYTVLFSNLGANDASAIVDKLKEAKVDYHLTANGTAVEVPSDKVYDLRLQMAGAGLPQGGNVGFEIFDKSSFGMTEFTQKLNYQRALQGELAKTISELGPVDQARVHLALPEQSLYEDKQEEPTASVVIKLRPNGQLDADQVSAITHLVAAAVEGMKSTNVAVVDTAGNLLSDAGSGNLSAVGLRLSQSQLQMQKQYEGQMSRDLQTMLEKVLGPGKAIVRVNADLNFDSKESDNEIVEPLANDRGVLVSEDKQEEKYSGAQRQMPGAPALAPTLAAPGAALTRTSATGDNYTRTTASNKYEVTKRVEHVTEAPGKVRRLSVAVLMDGTVTPAVSATIRNTVSAAVGLEPKRGDQVTVDSLPFDTTAAQAQEKEMQTEAKRDMAVDVAKWAAAVLLGLAFLFVLRSFLTNWKPAEVTESYPTPLPLQEAEALELVSAEPALPVHTPAPSPTRRASEVAQSDPEAVAKLVRTWLSEVD